MGIRLNDIESILRIKADQALRALRDTATGAEKLGTNLDKTDQKLGKLGRGLTQTANVATTAFGAAEAASGKSFRGAEQATTALLTGVAVLAQSAGALGGVTNTIRGLTTSVAGASTAISIGLVGALVLVAGFAAKTAIDLNKITRETDAINERLAKSSPLVAQYRAEVAALQGTINQYQTGQISANTALEEFNRFGLASIDQAQQRIDSLRRILPGLETQAAAERAVNAEIAFRQSVEAQVAKNAEARRLAAAVTAEEEAQFGLAAAERAKAAEAALLREIALRQERARQVVAQLVEESELREQARVEAERAAQGKGGLDPGILDVVPVQDLQPVVDLTEQIAQQTDLVADGFLQIGFNVNRALKPVSSFTETLTTGLTRGLEQGSALAAQIGVGLITASELSGASLRSLFVQLLKDIATAIIQATILKGVLGALGGGGGVLGFVGGLFQDPTADLFARAEGERFADLFFQGVQRQIGGLRERYQSALEDNRAVRESSDSPMSVIVEEASPETRVELIDRFVDPRIRTRNFQRTGTTTSVRNLS